MNRNFEAAVRGVPGLPSRFAQIHNLLAKKNNLNSRNSNSRSNNSSRRASFTPQTVKKHRSKTRKVRRRKL